MYIYSEQKKNLFTESGSVMFTKIRDNVKKLLSTSGAVMMLCAIAPCSGDVWDMMACVDRMVELGEIKEVTPPDSCAAQHRVFVKA